MLPILALTDARALMMAAGIDIVEFSAMALILVLLTARIVEGIKSSRAQQASRNNCTGDRFFKSKEIQALKPCPNCAQRLPISTLICYECDYNFLAERPGRNQRLLPPPYPVTHEVSERRVAL